MVGIWWVIALIAVVSLLNLLSGWAVGYLVFRTKKEQSERIFPAQRKKPGKPIIKDEFESMFVPEKEDESVLPPVVQRMNERMKAEQARADLRKVAGNG